jgi:hypothetical protein
MSTKGGQMRFCVVTSAIESAGSSRSHEVYSVGSLYFPACLRREHFPPDFYSRNFNISPISQPRIHFDSTRHPMQFQSFSIFFFFFVVTVRCWWKGGWNGEGRWQKMSSCFNIFPFYLRSRAEQSGAERSREISFSSANRKGIVHSLKLVRFDVGPATGRRRTKGGKSKTDFFLFLNKQNRRWRNEAIAIIFIFILLLGYQ